MKVYCIFHTVFLINHRSSMIQQNKYYIQTNILSNFFLNWSILISNALRRCFNTIKKLGLTDVNKVLFFHISWLMCNWKTNVCCSRGFSVTGRVEDWLRSSSMLLESTPLDVLWGKSQEEINHFSLWECSPLHNNHIFQEFFLILSNVLYVYTYPLLKKCVKRVCFSQGVYTCISCLGFQKHEISEKKYQKSWNRGFFP